MESEEIQIIRVLTKSRFGYGVFDTSIGFLDSVNTLNYNIIESFVLFCPFPQ